MKTQLFLTFLALNLIAPTALAIPSLSPTSMLGRTGWDNGNAGDTFASEFILTARDLLPRLNMLPQSELEGIDLNRLAGAVLNASVHSEEKLMLNGYEVDAINYPTEQKILISRSRWRTLRSPQETVNRLTLVLHEYLFLIGVDDTQFQVSGRLLPQMEVENFNPNRWWNPLNPVNRISLGLEYSPEGCKVPSLNFNLLLSTETRTIATSGSCGSAYRKISVIKNSFTAPPASGARGSFHRFDILVKNEAGDVLGAFTYEPKWGECLLPQDGTCRLSGKIFVGGVEFHFWLMR